MSDETLLPKPDDPVPSGLDATAKMCPSCGEAYTGEFHKECATTGGTLKKPPSSSKSHLDDMPPEATQVANDPARQLNQYLLVKQIGKGGMGAVWKAWDKKLTRWVAIKFLLATDEEDVARFQREAKLAARLRHPNIAPIYEVGEAPAGHAGDQARHYLAMEYIDGQSMASALNLPLGELLEMFVKISQGMEAAHKAGVVHRDLKPQNIMLTSDRWPYVMDFGLAKALQTESSLSVSGAVMGTPAYMPPEQAQGLLDQIDAQSDVYSLGATMYAVLCKKQPFTGQAPMEILMKVCKENPPSPRKLNPELPEAVERIVLKAMAKEKVDRYPSALALAEDLKRFLSHEEVQAKGPSSVKLVARKAKRNVWMIGSLVLVAAAAGSATLLLTRPKGDPKGVQKSPGESSVKISPEDADRRAQEAQQASEKKQQEEREALWLDEWLGKVRPALTYSRWKPGDAGLLPLAQRQLSSLSQANKLHALEAVEWLRGQAEEAAAAGRSLGKDRDQAARLQGWCDLVTQAAQGVDRLREVVDSLGPVRPQAAKIAQSKGLFTLKVIMGPFAELRKFSRGGVELPLSQRSTPLVLENLEVSDYELELFHPQFASKRVRIRAEEIKEGKTYLISGLMSDTALPQVRPLP